MAGGATLAGGDFVQPAMQVPRQIQRRTDRSGLHMHRRAALDWWEASDSQIGVTRFTQIGILRLLTTPAVMGGKPLGMDDAWGVHDRLFEDDRVVFVPEPVMVETGFRQYSAGRTASPKLWADAWLLALTRAADGTLVTFDRALAARSTRCLLQGTGHEA